MLMTMYLEELNTSASALAIEACHILWINLVVRKETPGPPKTGFEFYSSLVAHFIISISTQMLTITW